MPASNFLNWLDKNTYKQWWVGVQSSTRTDDTFSIRESLEQNEPADQLSKSRRAYLR